MALFTVPASTSILWQELGKTLGDNHHPFLYEMTSSHANDWLTGTWLAEIALKHGITDPQLAETLFSAISGNDQNVVAEANRRFVSNKDLSPHRVQGKQD